MPAKTHLKWTTIREFGGLWNHGGPETMPANGAQVMSGCCPLPGGGLRAFFKPTLYSTTAGLARSSPSKVSGYAFVPTSTVSDVILTNVVDRATTFPVNYRDRPDVVRPSSGSGQWHTWDGLAWSAATTDVATGAIFPTFGSGEMLTTQGAVAPLTATADPISGSPRRFASYYGPGGDPNGLVELGGSSFTVQNTVTMNETPELLVSHQNRLVGASGPFLVFTSPGVIDFPASGYADKFIGFGDTSRIVWIAPLPPSDLLVGTATGAVYNVQGDLADPVIRTLREAGTSNGIVCRPAVTPQGVVVLGTKGPYIFGTDGGQKDLAAGILSDTYWHVNEPTYVCYSGGYLMVRNDGHYFDRAYTYDSGILRLADVSPMDEWLEENLLHYNGALAYDFATNAWFTTTHPDVVRWEAPNIVGTSVDADYDTTDPEGYPVGIRRREITGAIEPLAYRQPTRGPRSNIYEWRSAPLRTESGRQANLRAVRLGAHGFGDSTSTLTITARNEDGDVETAQLVVPTGSSTLLCEFSRQMSGSYVDVSIRAASADPATEAPTLEFVSLGWTEGADIHQKPTDGGYVGAYPEGY